jgi:hypothetical protein
VNFNMCSICNWINFAFFYPLIGTTHHVLHYAYSFLILIHVCLSLASGGQLVQHAIHPRETWTLEEVKLAL